MNNWISVDTPSTAAPNRMGVVVAGTGNDSQFVGSFYGPDGQPLTRGPGYRIEIVCNLADLPLIQPGQEFLAIRRRGRWWCVALFEYRASQSSSSSSARSSSSSARSSSSSERSSESSHSSSQSSAKSSSSSERSSQSSQSSQSSRESSSSSGSSQSSRESSSSSSGQSSQSSQSSQSKSSESSQSGDSSQSSRESSSSSSGQSSQSSLSQSSASDRSASEISRSILSGSEDSRSSASSTAASATAASQSAVSQSSASASAQSSSSSSSRQSSSSSSAEAIKYDCAGRTTITCSISGGLYVANLGGGIFTLDQPFPNDCDYFASELLPNGITININVWFHETSGGIQINWYQAPYGVIGAVAFYGDVWLGGSFTARLSGDNPNPDYDTTVHIYP